MDKEIWVPDEYSDVAYPSDISHDNLLEDNIVAFELPSKYEHLNPAADLGLLDRLPLEILRVILLSSIDARTLMQFCQANRRATQIIRSLPEYKAIVKYAPNVLRGALAIGVGNFFSVGTLYRKLRRYECDDCGDFAGYLFLLSCRRVCHFCLHYDMAYLPIYPGKARSHIQPRMTIVPGLYAMIGRRLDRLALIDRAFATPAERFIYHNRQTSKSWERPGHPLRYVSVVRAPWFNTAQGQAEWGFHCVGCSNLSRFPRHWRRKFTAATFKEHLEECGEITNGRHIDV